jgi:flagellar protein FlaF
MQTMSGREVESTVLVKAAVALRECIDNWDAPDRHQKLDEALRYNQLIWSVFQSELLKEDNPLPRQLKEDILSLSAFIDKRTFEVMAYPDPEKLVAIININTNIAAGLRGVPLDEEAQQPTE